MAHAANIAQLTERLIRSFVAQQKADVSHLRDSANRSLRTSGHSRTNQFEVQSKFSGLIEKFAILNREDLSNALQSRLSDLPKESKWLPEVLSLLLMLSNRPVEHTKLEDVEALSGDSAEEAAKLTWEELFADDSNDDGLWEDIERGYHSSGDDATVDGADESDGTDTTQATSIGEEDSIALAHLHIVQLGQDKLDDVKSFHRQLGNALPTSELTTIRETLLMLHGLPTSAYGFDKSTQEFSPRAGVRLDTASSHLLHDAMMQFARVGSAVQILRRWLHSHQQVLYLQSCQASLQTLLTKFAGHLADLERTYLTTTENITVSLVAMRADVEKRSHPFLTLSRIVKEYGSYNATSPFALMDALYDEACISELSGDITVHQAILPVLLTGLRTYLRSLSGWVLHGRCSTEDTTSLSEVAEGGCELSRFWRDRYIMRTFASGQPCAPRCFHPFANRAFTLGKSRAFQRLLAGIDTDEVSDSTTMFLDFAQIEESVAALLPFSQVLIEAVESWLAEMAQDTTPSLRKALVFDHGLQATMSSLNHMFCSEDGLSFQAFADALFWSMEQKPKTWRNGFLLTELAQNTLASTSQSDHTLIVRIDENSKDVLSLSSIRSLASLRLETTFQWAIQNITCTASPKRYSKAFTLLLQTYRAKTLLRQQFPDLQSLAKTTTCVSAVHGPALRVSMLLMAFVDILQMHVTSTVAAMKESLLQDIARADDIDAMTEAWDRHDKQMATSLLLSEKLEPLKRTLIDLLEACEKFHILWEELKANASIKSEVDNNHTGKGARIERRVDVLRSEVDKSLSFLIAGLRGTSRASGNTALEALAERLEWIVH